MNPADPGSVSIPVVDVSSLVSNVVVGVSVVVVVVVDVVVAVVVTDVAFVSSLSDVVESAPESCPSATTRSLQPICIIEIATTRTVVPNVSPTFAWQNGHSCSCAAMCRRHPLHRCIVAPTKASVHCNADERKRDQFAAGRPSALHCGTSAPSAMRHVPTAIARTITAIGSKSSASVSSSTE